MVCRVLFRLSRQVPLPCEASSPSLLALGATPTQRATTGTWRQLKSVHQWTEVRTCTSAVFMVAATLYQMVQATLYQMVHVDLVVTLYLNVCPLALECPLIMYMCLWWQ